jgi:rare lipoprotein A
MASNRRLILLALVVALCQPLINLDPISLHAQEKSDQSLKEKTAISEAPSDGKEGTATDYAKRYHGKRTHSGALYHHDKMTAASPDLPMGSKVLVKNLDNGKEVSVVVNDRCRKRGNPFIDLSRAAAKKLGFFGRGKARVLITRLEDDESS